MTLRRTAQYHTLSLFLAVLSLALAYAMNGYFLFSTLAAAAGVLWHFDRKKRWGRFSPLLFVAFTASCVLGFWLKLSMPLLVLGLTAALSAWDLDNFSLRMHQDPPVANLDRLESHHLKRLAIVSGAGLVIAELVFLVQVSLSFWVLFLAALVALFSLMRFLALIRSEG